MGADATRVGVLVRGAPWTRAIPGAAAKSRRAARAALAALRAVRPGDITLVLADDATLRRLNRAYRGQNKPTNVLSFPLSGGRGGARAGEPIGDVVLALETVLAEAARQGKRAGDHLMHLVVHGVLHLFGHDHRRAAEAKRMEAIEVRVLRGLGVADPYRVRPPVRAERRAA